MHTTVAIYVHRGSHICILQCPVYRHFSGKKHLPHGGPSLHMSIVRPECIQKMDSCVRVVSSSNAFMPMMELPLAFSLGLHTVTE